MKNENSQNNCDKVRVVIALGCKARHQAKSLAVEASPKKSNWRDASATAARLQTGQYLVHDLGRYSRKCKYTHYEYTPIMQSWGVLLNGGTVLAGRIGKHGFRLAAPKGYIFASDSLGAKIASRDGKRDYHFHSDEVNEGGVRLMMQKARANWQAQADQKRLAATQKREQTIFNREVGSCRVTLDDSRRAGNCVEGTLAYAEAKLGVTRQQVIDCSYLFSVPARKILAINGHDGVQRAVRMAWLRETTVSI